MNFKRIIISVGVASSLVSLSAYELKPIGYKAVGMGGAGVASTRGSLATYYNPALLGISDYTTTVSLNVGVGIRENKLIDTVDKLDTLNLSDTIDEFSESNGNIALVSTEAKKNITEAIEVINQISNANGLELSPSFSLGTQISRYFGIGVYATSEIRANLNIDKDRLSLIFENEGSYYQYDQYNGMFVTNITETSFKEKSLQYSIEGGEDQTPTTYLNVSTLVLAEVPISFAYPIEQNKGTWSFGISGKVMQAETFHKTFDIDTDTDNITDDYEENSKTYSTVGIDIGMLYKENKTGLTLALVGKNINSPEFETEPDENGDTESFKFEPFFRAGLSLPVWNDNIEFAIDADLQQSDTSYEGMKSQYVGGGMEFHPASWFALRAGLMKNVATESINEGFIYTAGFGFGLKWLQLDASVQMSQETGTFEDEEIPKYVAANISLISRWGDGYNRKVPPAE